MNITINSIRGNVIEIAFNDYFPTYSDEPRQRINTRNIVKVCEKKLGTELGIEVHTVDSTENFYLCFDESFSNFRAVTSIYGNVPESHENLLDLLTQLL